MRELTSARPPEPGPAEHRRGGPSGEPVVIYADFTCPQCALASLKLRESGVETIFRHMAISSRHRRAVAVAEAVEAAGQQGFFWEFHDLLFEDQGRLDDPHLWDRCRTLGIDIDRFEQDRRAPAGAERVRGQTAEALRAGATGTPSFLVGGILTDELPASVFG
jgi:protein-disulfide isomerase